MLIKVLMKTPKSHNQSEDESEKREYDDTRLFKNESEPNWVCSRVKQIENWKEALDPERLHCYLQEISIPHKYCGRK